jgi:hypothetical protein
MVGTDMVVTMNLIIDQHGDPVSTIRTPSSLTPAGWPIRNWSGRSPR